MKRKSVEHVNGTKKTEEALMSRKPVRRKGLARALTPHTIIASGSQPGTVTATAMAPEDLPRGVPPHIAALPLLTSKIYRTHTFKIEGLEPQQIEIFGSFEIARCLAQAYAKAMLASGSTKGIACSPYEAFTITGYDPVSCVISARLKESAQTMDVRSIPKAPIDVPQATAEDLKLTGRHNAERARIHAPPPPEPAWGDTAPVHLP